MEAAYLILIITIIIQYKEQGKNGLDKGTCGFKILTGKPIEN